MGYNISWIGFNGISKDEVLRLLGATDTGVIDEANEAPFSGAEIPGGWFILFSNDFDFASEEALASLSSNCNVVACQVSEAVMVCIAYAYSHGTKQWTILHSAQKGIRDLVVSGSPPFVFEQIRERLSLEQEARGGESAGVDYFFDIPVETAEAICGFRYDRWKFEWGEPKFTVLDIG